MDYVHSDPLWDVSLVVFCVLTLVMSVSSLVVLSCLKRETKKFHKRLGKKDSNEEPVKDIHSLERIMIRYVRNQLDQGTMQKIANSFSMEQKQNEGDIIREEAIKWFLQTLEQLRKTNLTEKMMKKTVLAAVRTGMVKHPMDLRGSRRSLEAANIFLTMNDPKEDPSLIANNIPELKPKSPRSMTCLTYPCQWASSKLLNLLSLCVAHPASTSAAVFILHILIWCYELLTDVVFINNLWDFRIPIMYWSNSTNSEDISYLSYQSMTVDLYAPLLVMMLMFSLLFLILSCSFSHLGEQYRYAAQLASPDNEKEHANEPDPTHLLSRFDFHISQATTSSLAQFCVQLGGYLVILYLMETGKRTTPDQNIQEKIQEKINSFYFSSLWFSCLGSALSLTVGQYSALMLQYEYGLTPGQRLVYFLACIFNTVAMMSTTLVFFTMIILMSSDFIGHYHFMIIIIICCAVLGISVLVSLIMAICGMDQATIMTDRVVTTLNPKSILTAFLRFSRSSSRHSALLLGGVTLIGKLFSLLTVNLFLPPSQLLIHPFCKFYSTCPRSPALHSAVARQLIIYNILLITTSILLCVNINSSLTQSISNLMICANLTAAPAIFISYLILYKFYSSWDLWTSNGVHLVYQQDFPTLAIVNEDSDLDANTRFDETTLLEEEEEVSDIENYKEDYPDKIIEDASEFDSQEKESKQTDADKIVLEEQFESTEVDRMLLMKTQSKKLLKKQRKRISKGIRKPGLCDLALDVGKVVTKGRWVNVSDL